MSKRLRKVDLFIFLVRPIVRFALRHGIQFQEASRILKECFVHEAIHALESSNQKVNESRLSAATGIRRKDLGKIQKNENLQSKSGLLSRVIGHWTLSKEFRLKNGQGKPLSYEGLESDFSKLVYSISLDLHPGTVLNELERLNLVVKNNGKVRLLSDVGDLGDKPVEAFELLSQNSDDLIKSVEQNVIKQNEEDISNLPNLHASTEFTRIDIEGLEEIKNWLLTEGSSFHHKARKIISRFDLDLHPKKENKDIKTFRVSIGTFGLTEMEKSSDA